MPKKPNNKIKPRILLISGLDPSGGAGAIVDVQVATALGFQPQLVISCLTAQTSEKFFSLTPTPQAILEKQLKSILVEEPPQVIKIGLLPDSKTIKTIAAILKKYARKIPIVIDPILETTSGTKLGKLEKIKSLKKELFPLATVITPNKAELQALASSNSKPPLSASKSLERLSNEFTKLVIAVKSYSISNNAVADIILRQESLISYKIQHKKLRLTQPVRGTGCRFATLLACKLVVCRDGSTALVSAFKEASDELHRLLSKHRYNLTEKMQALDATFE